MIDLPDGIRARPGDERGFIHKKILGGISTIAGVASAVGIPGARFVSRVTGAFSGRGRATGRALVPRTETARVTKFSQAEKDLGRTLKFEPETRMLPAFSSGARTTLASSFREQGPARQGPCEDPRLVRAPDGHCVFPGSPHFSLHFPESAVAGGAASPVGDAVMGQYGAGLVPGSRIIDRAVCLKGMQLGNDGVCYNKSQITNKQRMWPAGRKPLLTGGDMRAISTAARAGKRLEVATKRLQRMGMMKKPARRAGPTQHQRLLEAHVTK